MLSPLAWSPLLIVGVDGHRSLIFLMDQVREAEPQLDVNTPDIPPRTEVSGVEFIEFAANEAEADELAQILDLLGFSQIGKHQSKQVMLYRQGEINLVINTEREGLAHAAYVTHGTAAYAMGLRVSDAETTVARTGALDAKIFEQVPGAGELSIPAIRGVGGGVIYFLDQKSKLGTVWQTAFAPLAAEPGIDCGLVRIDHVAQTMNYEEMLTWVLFYRSIFAVHKSPMVDVLDPAGLIRSQVIENDDGSLRLTLNGAENSRTLAGHFIANTFGSSIQHLAFSTRDIFATANLMRRRGLQLLEISSNYYDDLEARLGLDPDFTQRLRDASVLYDRDQTGEFFQFYSRTFGEGFFFEIVERRGRYSGYGAANAPFRIAAQKRQIRPPSVPRA